MTASLAERCAAGGEQIRRNERERQRLMDAPEFIRLWDGEWNLHHVCGNEYEHTFSWVSNDTGTGSIELDFDSPQGLWLYDMWGRLERDEKRNVHITVDDPAGARWGGRLDSCTVSHKEDGQRVVIAEFLHDYEDLKWVTVWSNPFLPAAFQFPRGFLLAGPVTWILKTTLWLQLFRYKNPLITIPDDPLDFSAYDDFLDMSTWDIVVKPTSFIEAMESGVVWGLVSSRWKTWHDMAHVMLEDSELSVECTRWLEGDPPPWDGANLRHGTLVVDIVDKSGTFIGTAHGGTMLDGFGRTVAEFFEDFVDSSLDLVLDTDSPQEYFIPGNRLTHKEQPGVVYLEGIGSGIETSDFINSPAKGDTVNVGGHSMPGINESISASIQAVYDILGNLVLIGSLGGTVDTLLQPLYEDCVSGDTIIEGPDGKERIDVLAERGGSFRVWARTEDGACVPATAVFAFKKGHTELFEYVLANGYSIKATRQHRWLTRAGWEETAKAVVGTDVATIDGFSPVVAIHPLGKQDFYDMHVPGLENYLANGIWNHNTILAWWSMKNTERAQNSGWSRYHEYRQDGAGKAYTIASLMVLRAGFWATKTTLSNKITITNNSPFLIGPKGHWWHDDRIGFNLQDDPTGRIWVDRARKIELKRDAEGKHWVATVGDERLLQDPAMKAWGRIEQIVASLSELGAW